MGQATAKMNVADLRKVLGLSEEDTSLKSPDLPSVNDSLCETSSSLQVNNASSITTKRPTENSDRFHRVRRESMEQLHLIKVVSYILLICALCNVFTFLKSIIMW